MDAQTLKAALDARPFVPFRLHGSRGQAYDVPTPQRALLTRTVVLIGVDPGPDGVPAEFRTVPLPQVARMEPLAAP